MDDTTRTEVEAAVFRRLVKHLQDHPEAQNIDLMILVDFCRNCLAKWYMAAAGERDQAIDYDGAREIVYGMPYGVWKQEHQQPATSEQMAAFKARQEAKTGA